MSNNFRYIKLTENELKNVWIKHKKIIETFLHKNHFTLDNIYINEKSVYEIISKVHQRQKYYEYFHGLEMSEFKEIALISFWYIKMKPICVALEDKTLQMSSDFEAINEKLALYLILCTFRGIMEDKKMSTKVLDSLPEEYLYEIIYSFAYRDISKEALILIVESIAVFLGLKPYKQINKSNENQYNVI